MWFYVVSSLGSEVSLQKFGKSRKLHKFLQMKEIRQLRLGDVGLNYLGKDIQFPVRFILINWTIFGRYGGTT
jgi:hypothetical protein